MTIGRSTSSLNLGTILSTTPRSKRIKRVAGKATSASSPLPAPAALAAWPALSRVATGSDESSLKVVRSCFLSEEGGIEKGEGVRWMRCEEIEGAMVAIKLAEAQA